MEQAIGSFLRELRKEKGLTQEELAEQLNVSNKTLSRWETGKRTPDLESLLQLADHFSVSVQELIEGKRAETPPELTRETLQTIAQYSTEKEIKKKKGRVILEIAAGLGFWLLVGAIFLVIGFRRELKSLTTENYYTSPSLYLKQGSCLNDLYRHTEWLTDHPDDVRTMIFLYSESRNAVDCLCTMVNNGNEYQACIERYHLAWTLPKELRFFINEDSAVTQLVRQLDHLSSWLLGLQENNETAPSEEISAWFGEFTPLLKDLSERLEEAELPSLVSSWRGLKRNLLFLEKQGDLLSKIADAIQQRPSLK